MDGYQGNANDAGAAKRNPLQALEQLEKLPADAPAIFILRDFHRFLDDIAISRKLRNLARKLKSQPKNVVIIAPIVQIPRDLSEVLNVLDFRLPTVDDIAIEVDRLAGAMGTKLEPSLRDDIIRSCQGLSLERVRRVLGKAIALDGALNEDVVPLVLSEKQQTIRQTQILEFYPASEAISD
ncbi:MAG: AAA family ATPase, partial [Coleofasciculaceae cyanobacterium RL_1_1]|nr:AAA family ATPase [Coleofasciculaceae cyanobacterium RL_1_1]